MGKRDTRPRTDCPTCERDVAIDGSGRLYRHNYGYGAQCAGSRTLAWELDPNLRESEPNPADVPADEDPPAWLGPHQNAQDELATWWRDLADDEIGKVVAKAVEYGATDLRDLGYQVLEMAGRRDKTMPIADVSGDGYATEVGIAFYAMGKLARIAAAIKEGRRPSFDSWHDLGVYARMAQRVHLVGAWPGVQKPILAKRFRAYLPATDEEIEQARRDAAASEPILRRVLDGLKSDNWGRR